MNNGGYWRNRADKQGVPLRTLNDVADALAAAKRQGADAEMARLMLRHGRLTDEAREYVARHYPQ